MIVVMLNTNVYGRPFDDLHSPEIAAEASAAYKIFLLGYSGLITIRTSDVLFAELSVIKDAFKKKFIFHLVEQTGEDRIKLSKEVVKLADSLSPIVKDYMDSLHVAFSAAGRCNYLVTCDKEILSVSQAIENLLSQYGFKTKIITPVDFVKEAISVL